jgi:hypothetical protein
LHHILSTNFTLASQIPVPAASDRDVSGHSATVCRKLGPLGEWHGAGNCAFRE